MKIFEALKTHGLLGTIRICIKIGLDWIYFGCIRGFIIKIINLSNTRSIGSNLNDKILYVFYDFENSPITFDIVAFLINAEIFRRANNYSFLCIVLVPGKDKGFRKRSNLNKEEMKSESWRIRNILIPCCYLLPSCRNVMVYQNREDVKVFLMKASIHKFPADYNISISTSAHSFWRLVDSYHKNGEIPSIHPTPQAIKYINEWISNNAQNRKVITITLRTSPYGKDRNSNIGAWCQFADTLKKTDYLPIFIRDTDDDFQLVPKELQGFKIFSAISWNVELRTALYEQAYLNMFVNNGPVILCILNKKTRYLSFKLITETSPETTVKHMKMQKILPGKDYPFATSFQKLIWEDDKFPVIEREFKKIVEEIEDMETNN